MKNAAKKQKLYKKIIFRIHNIFFNLVLSKMKQDLVTSGTIVPKNRNFSFLYFSSIIFSFIGITLFIVFVAGIKRTKTRDGDTISNPPSKSIVLSSFFFLLFSIIGLSVNLIWYFRIFRFEKSPLFYSFVAIGFLNIIFLGLSLYFYTKRYNICPTDQIFSTKRNRCIDNCPPDNYFNDELNKCSFGCNDEYPCEKSQCVAGVCCPDDNYINCGNKCCLPNNCYSDICCSTPLCNGKCCGDIGICVNNDHCEIKCGSTGCAPGKACMEIDVGSDDYKDFVKNYPDAEVIEGKAYACVTITDQCQPLDSPQNFPPPIALADMTNFYPVLDATSQEDIQKSQQDFADASWKNNILTTVPNKGHVGAYCGTLENPIRFVQYKLNPNCSYQKCVDLAFPNVTTNVALQKDDDFVYCNYVLNYGVNFSQKPLNSYSLTYYDDKTNQPVYEKRRFHSAPTNSLTPQNFQTDCSLFQNKCPVENLSTYSCQPSVPTENEANWINSSSSAKCQMLSAPKKPISTSWILSLPSNTLQYNDTITLLAKKDEKDPSFSNQFLSTLRYEDKSPSMRVSKGDAANLKVIPFDSTKSGDVMTGDLFFLQVTDGEFRNAFLSTSCEGTNTPCFSSNQSSDEIWSFFDSTFKIGKSINKGIPYYLQKTGSDHLDSVSFYGWAVAATSENSFVQPSMQNNLLYLQYICENSDYNPRNPCLGSCTLPYPDISTDPVSCSTPSADTKPFFNCFTGFDKGPCLVHCCDYNDTKKRISEYQTPNDGMMHSELLSSCSLPTLKNDFSCDCSKNNKSIWFS